MGGADAMGWLASAILIATLLRQVYTQWKQPSGDGVSIWLFAGQMAASVGFVAYSWMLGNWVFIVTNTVILATAVLGQVVTVRNRHRAAQQP